MTMLALKNADGVVLSTLAGLSRLGNLSYEECQAAILVLERPDTRSELTQEFDGRRVERVAGGWKILNHDKYRDLISKTKRRAYQASWQKEYRKRVKAGTEAGRKDGATRAIVDGLKEGNGAASGPDLQR